MFLNCPGVCATAGVGASAALATATEAPANFMNPLRSLDIFLSVRIWHHHFSNNYRWPLAASLPGLLWVTERQGKGVPSRSSAQADQCPFLPSCKCTAVNVGHSRTKRLLRCSFTPNSRHVRCN